MRIILLNILFIFMFQAAQCKELIIGNSEIRVYPEKTIEFYYYDNDNSFISDINKSDLRLEVDGKEMNDFIFFKPTKLVSTPTSIVISLDISELNDNNLEIIKTNIKLLEKYIPSGSIEFSVHVYNSDSYILQDFITDYSQILRAVNLASAFGINNFNTGFLKSKTGSIDLIKSSNRNKVIINFTQGFGLADSNSIVNAAQSNGVKIYNFIFNDIIPISLNSISDKTNGMAFKFESSNRMLSEMIYVLNKETGIDPFRVSYNLPDCNLENLIDLTINNSSNDKFSAYYNPNQLPFIEISPSSINFGKVPIGENKFNFFSLIARNADIDLLDIIFDSTTVKISSEFKNITLLQNSPKVFQIEFTSNSTEYYYSEMELLSNACKVTTLNLLSGKDGNSTSTKLKVVTPNGNEIYYPGQYIKLLWDGVIDSQKVIIDYSSNNGNKWVNIAKEAILKFHEWEVPNIESDDMLLRVSIPSGQLKYENIDYVEDDDKNNTINNSDLSYNDRYAALSFDDGSIFIWDLDSNRIKSQLRDKNIGKVTTDIGFSKNSSLFAASFGSNGDYNVVYWDSENTSISSSKSFNNRPIDIEWSKNGISLYIAFQDGELIEWNTATGNLINIISLDGIDKISECNSLDLLAIATQNKVILTDLGGNRLDSVAISNKIIDLGWSPTTNKLFIVYDFSDLRIFRTEIKSGVYHLSQDPRITRSNLPNLTGAEWVTNNAIALSAVNSSIIEYWNINGNKIFDFELHEANIQSFSSRNKKIISAAKINFGLVWDVDDYPFNFKTIDKDSSNKNWSIRPIKLSKQNIDLGNICINNSYSYTNSEAIINNNDINIVIDSIAPISSQFRIDNPFPILIESNSPLTLNFTHLPINLGSIANKFIIYRGANKDTIIVKSENKKPAFEISTSEISFENILANTINRKSVDILRNTSNSKLSFDKVELQFGSEVFKIINSNISNLNQNDVLNIELEFLPINSGEYSGLIKLSSEDVCSPIYISIYGSATNSIIKYNNIIDLGLLECDDNKDTTIYFENFSLSSIGIEGFEILNNSNDFYKVITEVPTSVDSNDSLLISIKTDKTNFGIFNSTLLLKTNLFNKDSIIKIDLTTIRDSINLEFSENMIDFGTVSLLSNSTKTIRVINKSLIEYTFDTPTNIGLFQMKNATPKTIAFNDTSIVEFEFEGFEKDTLVQTQFHIDSSCFSSFILPVIVNVSNGIPILSHKDSIDLGTVNCNNELVYNIKLSNTGKSNLIIDSLIIEDINNEFRFGSNNKDISINPNEFELFDLIYNTENIGKKSITVRIYSNSSIGLSEIIIKINQNKTELLLLSDSLKFVGLRSNKPYSREIIIQNIGNILIAPTYVNGINFIIDSIRPEFILPDEIATVYITFLGGQVEANYSSLINLEDECENKYPIYLEASVGGNDFITLKPSDIEAKTGDLINLNINFNNTTSVDLEVNDTIRTTLVLNSTLLSPIKDEHKGIIDNNGNRSIELEFPVVSNSIIYQLPMIVTLGDTSYSDIKLIESTHLNDDFYIDDIESGSITVTNIVTKPTERYIDGQGKAYLSETLPSPVLNTAIIKYGVIETTNVIISLYDINGIKIEELVNEFHKPGEYELEINPQNLTSGNYLYKLETSSMEIIKKMTIIH